MSQTHAQYLQEMGISQWELSHPERLAGYESELTPLSNDCKLLLVSPEKPQEDLAVMFERVLKSIKLDLSQALHIQPQHLSSIELGDVEWVWFAGCESAQELKAKTLQSPLLSDINGNNQHRRDLWQQICAYD
ncbi:DNA polymerase III psi subunit [Vibrio crassostreae]|uniref:DNA polymerase III subunit psi n=1 Tax=Vibrio TaxID=662 RepID=UPI00104EF835|nr:MULTISPECIES: DNA polymerase III subunit psi [Vibrio]MCG9545013.1 DNA polymerase III subunit psi [Vibrio sp. Isolate33]TCN80552.1 DNA polymerase III psi subunit [Vibrio crassostreae]TWD42142.1 DNA polymerase III psi subunit [Vibrio crassostreae]TWD74449.1 DNA polymerase III psi subunit [Vibrio crassostreae]CAK2620123.1 DNA polymerase III subunit psi [Vibrio crassostreae]